MVVEGNHIIADKGKVFRRKNTDEVFGEDIYLGYSYYIGGVLQDPPHLDTPEDFEEIPMPKDYESAALGFTDTDALNIILGND